MEKTRKYKKIIVNKEYLYIDKALNDKNFIYYTEYLEKNGNTKTVYENLKNGKKYIFVKAEHFNSFIYDITLREITI